MRYILCSKTLFKSSNESVGQEKPNNFSTYKLYTCIRIYCVLNQCLNRKDYMMDTPEGKVTPASSTKSSGGCCKRFLRRNLLLILLILSLILGIAMGIGLRFLDPPLNKRQLTYFKFPGELLMRMLKMLILPLIISSLVAGVAGMDSKASGKMGLRAVVYYLSTTFIAVILGIVLVVTIQPGSRSVVQDNEASAEDQTITDSFLDLLRYAYSVIAILY